MSGTKKKFLFFLLVQLLAFSSVKAVSPEAPCCILDKRFGEFCPTTCGVSNFYQDYQSNVNKELEDIEKDLNTIHNVSTITKNKIDNIVQTNTIMKKQSSDIYIHRLREIQSEILMYEKNSKGVDTEIQDLESIVLINSEKISSLKKVTQQLHDRCSASCQDTVQINEITGQDCQDIANKGARTSGLYHIRPLRARRQFLVYCEIDSAGRGWTVLQRRLDGSVEFAQNWIPYKEGFGYLSPDDSTEFWLGNEKIHLITTQGGGPYLLEIVMKDWSNERRVARYMQFKVGSEEDKYRLRYSYYEGGDAGDAFEGVTFPDDPSSAFLTAHNGMQFSTPDVDNDKYEQASCAEQDQSGWWMNRCHAANLNGKYHRDVYKLKILLQECMNTKVPDLQRGIQCYHSNCNLTLDPSQNPTAECNICFLNRGGYYTVDATTGGYDNGIIWATWHDRWYSLRETTMKIMPYKKYSELRSQTSQAQVHRGDSSWLQV